VDPVTAGAIGAILSGVLSDAGGEAGAHAVQVLRRLIRSANRPAVEAAAVEAKLERATPEATDEIAAWLLASAHADTDFARELDRWLDETRPLLTERSVHNEVGHVEGSVIQADTIETDSIDLR
jgi:hypothetical protein